MKNTCFSGLLLLLLNFSAFGYNSPAQKYSTALADPFYTGPDLKTAFETVFYMQQAIISDEWNAFRKESLEKIRSNEMRIAELNVQLNKPGTKLDTLYKKRFQSLEKQNNEMKTRLEVYSKNQSDWENFKRGYNQDMDELLKALKDLSVVNTK